jgi:hypothetical protein
MPPTTRATPRTNTLPSTPPAWSSATRRSCSTTPPGTWRKITSRGADSDEIFITLTNEIALPPGILSEVYRLRWKIEKAFDQQERKLDEGNAWATSDTAKEIQAIAICLAHNLLQILRATLALLRPLMLKYV